MEPSPAESREQIRKPRTEGTEEQKPRRRRRRETGLNAKDRTLLALLASCRYLTTSQVQKALGGPRDVRTLENRLRAMAGDTRNVKLPDVGTVVLRRLRFRGFDGAPLVLWTPTQTGYLVASRELGREVKVPRVDIGASFAEHAVALTDLLVALAAPYMAGRTAVRDLPFSWDVTEDTHLPWREPSDDGRMRDRVLLPDAILELPSARLRLFVECETGTHTLVPVSRDKNQATVRKAERYETFLNGLSDVPNRVTHYARKYPDGWAAEVLFLVPTDGRRVSTEAALATVASAASRVTFRVCTLEEALAYVQGLLPAPPDATAPRPAPTSLPFSPEEHRTLNAFVVESTAALAQANMALRRHGAVEVVSPPSTARMLALLWRTQRVLHAGPWTKASRA
jgi:hypothetical protein